MKAALIGINDYPGAPLNGCVNDVLDMQGFLLSRGASHSDLMVLTDSDATKANIEESIRWALDVGEGETCLVHYSGHGSQVQNTGGDWEGDRLDEIICPHDYESLWDDPASDDWLRGVMSKWHRRGNAVIILDCCHSGTGSRNALIRPKRVFAPPGRALWHSTPEVGECVLNRIGVAQTPSGEVSERMRHALLAACADHQTAADMPFGESRRWNGAFTRGLLDTVGMYDKYADLESLFLGTKATLRKWSAAQRPQIEGSKSVRRAAGLLDFS